MAHQARLFIAEELEKQECCVCKLSKMIGADVSTVSRHLSVTTKTPMNNTKLPLRTWLLAMYFIINSSKGVSAVFLAKWLGGGNQKTA
jgi:DNA-binding transcriptional ArsR family regulator